MPTEKLSVDPSYFDQVAKQLDTQSRLYAKELHEGEYIGRYVYGAYGFLDGLNLALTIPKLAFEEAYFYTDISSSAAWHDWMKTPEGIAIMVVESVALMSFATFGSLFEDKDKNAYRRFFAFYWPYIRDVLKALKWAYKGVRNTLMAVMPFCDDIHSLILPLGIALGVLSLLNRIWMRWMKAERKSMMKDNALLQAEICDKGCSLHVMTALPPSSDKTYIKSYILVKKHCGLLLMSTPPTQKTLDLLPNGLDAAYIRCHDQLFYVDKTTRSISMVCADKEALVAYDTLVKTESMHTEPLTLEHLNAIEGIVKHKHEPKESGLFYINSRGKSERVALDNVHAFEASLNKQLVTHLLEVMSGKLNQVKANLGTLDTDLDTLHFMPRLPKPTLQNAKWYYTDNTLFGKYIYITDDPLADKKLIHIGMDGESIAIPVRVAEKFQADFITVKANKNLIGLTAEQINHLILQHDGPQVLHLMSVEAVQALSHKNCYVWDGAQLSYIHNNASLEKNITILDSDSFHATLTAMNGNASDVTLHLSAEQVRELITHNVDYPRAARRDVGLSSNEWAIYRHQIEYGDDLLLLSQREGKLDLAKLSKLSKKHSDTPILIKQANKYSIYGSVDGNNWALTELDAGIVAGVISNSPLPFPAQRKSAQILHYNEAYKNIYENIALKKGHTFKSKIKSQSQPFQVVCLLMAAYAGLANSLYFYMGAMSLAFFVPPAFIAMAILSTVFAITFITTSIYEEYDFQRKLQATETKIKLALHGKELDILITELSNMSELVAFSDVESDSVLEVRITDLKKIELSKEQKDLLDKLERQLQVFLACENELRSQIVLSPLSAGIEGLKNGLAVQGAITSFMFATSTVLLLLAVPCPPMFIIACAAVGMACLIAFLIHAIVTHSDFNKTRVINNAALNEKNPREALRSFLNRLKPMREEAFKVDPNDILGSRRDIWDRSIDPSPQFFIVEWCENIRQLFSGSVKGEKFVGEFTNEQATHEAPVLFAVMGLSAITAGVIFLLRTLAKFFGIDPVDAVPTKATDLSLVNLAETDDDISGPFQTEPYGGPGFFSTSSSPIVNVPETLKQTSNRDNSVSPIPYGPGLFHTTTRHQSHHNFNPSSPH